MELNFTVTNQKIKYVSNLYIVEKSRNYLTAKFSFSGNEWKNVVKTAIFKKDDTVINVVLDESGRCDVPWEVITKGTLKVSVFGGDLVTVDTADVKILKSGYEEGNAPSEPTPDVYAQILTELQDIRSEYVTEEMLGQAVEDWLAENVVEALSPEDVQKIVYGWLEEHKTELKGEKGDSGENGIDGKDGVDGKNGITFTPIIVDGVLSWENNGELDNPTSFDFNEELGINTIKSDVETLKDKKDITETTSTTQPNSHAGREMVLEIGGVTEQDSTTGKNLLDCRGLVETEKNGITFTPVYENGMLQYIEVNGTATARADFTINERTNVTDKNVIFSGISGGSAITYSMFLAMVGNETTYNSIYNTEKEVTFADDIIYYVVKIRVVEGQTVSNLKFYPMIRNADIVDATYEPFTNGPAPNPSYPMPIKNSKVKGIRTHHENFLKNTATSNTANGGTFTVNNDGTVTVNGTFTADTAFNILSDDVPISSEMYFNVLQLSGSYSGDIKARAFDSKFGNNTSGGLGEAKLLKSGIKYSIFRFTIYSGTVCNNLKLGFMVATEGYDTYKPYTSSEYTFSQPIDLYGMNGVQDVIMEKPIKRRFDVAVFDGSDDEDWKQSSTYNTRYYINIHDSLNNAVVLCTHGIKRSSTTNGSCRIDNNLNFSIDTEFATVDEWKAHLASKPMEVVYELAEEVTEELPIADQIGLNSLDTYDGITYVEFIYDGLEPTFKGKYGTSEVGGYTLESLLTARNNELKQELANERLSALEASVVNNI